MNLMLRGLVGSLTIRTIIAAFGQGQEIDYLANFDAINDATYSVVKDSPDSLPTDLLAVCSNGGSQPSSGEVVVQADASGIVNSAQVAAECGVNSVCVIPIGTTLLVDDSINLGALIVRGTVEWTDATQTTHQKMFLCAGYVAVEGQGKWEMDLHEGEAFIYVKDNGYEHDHLRSRAFGSYAALASDYPIIEISGRELTRTWSVLAKPLQPGGSQITLMHDANLMGWRVGDRIGISPTQPRASGIGEEFTIAGIDTRGVIALSGTAQYPHDASFIPPNQGNQSPALMSAEVVNLSRNIVITGDEFKHVPCDSSLPESVDGEETSVEGCRCASVRQQCTMGLHTAVMHGGTAKIQNARVERCGQRGVEGKYCLHFHKLHDCPTCLFKNNAIEGSHQRGIIVHGTHSSTVENNVLYNVRGAGIYIEDGNEMYNDIKYNVVLCPNQFGDATLHGCTIPGTSNRLADTSDNHSGIFSRAVSNSLTGNRVANAFNGMFFSAGGRGRGGSAGRVCESAAKLARIEGNTWHGNGRFGTYTLGSNYAKETDQSILNDGHNIDQSLCEGFDGQGYERGAPGSMVDNLDYHNAFVGHYGAGDIQHNGHRSYKNLNLIYWKTTKNFGNGCSGHLVRGSYADGNMALPDQATFIIEDTTFGDGAQLEANHHCNVGVTGVLCFPQYILHNVQWTNSATRWMWFQSHNTQGHNANQNHGGVFTLSPPDAQVVMTGGQLENNFFPPGLVSLVSNKFSYLLSLPGEPCILSTAYGSRYDGGILCSVPLRSLKVYSRGLESWSAPAMRVEIWFDRAESGVADSDQIIPFHQIGNDRQTAKQGYSLPVIPGAEHSYRLTLLDGNGDIPSTWVVEFSDLVIGNRWTIEYINLSLNGFQCGLAGLISSHHDRRFIWSGDADYMDAQAWGNTGACAAGPDSPLIDCDLINDGILPAAECPELCGNTCNASTTYCDCGSATCKLKPGFTDTIDLCAAARCGENGTCSAKYLGGTLPVTSNACICDEGWAGPLCQFNPCEIENETCNGHGTCVALSDTESRCECDLGYSGDSCETTCGEVCPGNGGVYPYNCNPNIGGSVIKYGCSSSGGCYYLSEGQEYPHDGFCTFREVVQESNGCLCGSENDCELTVACNLDESCPSPQHLPDSSPCNSVPFGTCIDGVCLAYGTTNAPISSPTHSPTQRPTTAAPIPSPTNTPTSKSAPPVSIKPTFSPTNKPSPTPQSPIVPVADWSNPNDLSAPVGTYFSFEEGDWEAIFGALCQFGPCQAQGVDCGDHGACVAVSETEAKCKCDTDYSGDTCETTCYGVCGAGGGSYPYGCNPNLGEAVAKYGCLPQGGCNYLVDGADYPHAGFCTFKEVVREWNCYESGSIFKVNQRRGGEVIWTGDVKVWPAAAGISAHGRREPAEVAFQEGDTIAPWSLSDEPTKNPSQMPVLPPSEMPTISPTKEPTKNPTDDPIMSPTKTPTEVPTTEQTVPPTIKPTSLTSIPVIDWVNPGDSSVPIGTYFPFDESDWETLFGPLCQSPCQGQDVACGEHGTCTAISGTEMMCKCDANYSGDTCETTCGGVCLGGDGTYPYGCNPNLAEAIVKYGCFGRGCNYLAEGEDYPHPGFCTFKEVIREWNCLESGSIFRADQWREGEVIWTGDIKVWPAAAGNDAYGRREPLMNSIFQDGDKIMPPPPSNMPTGAPTTNHPTNNPTSQPTPKPTSNPTNQPTLIPTTARPTNNPALPTSSILLVDWTNPDNPTAPAGTYFPFVEAEWEAVFGPMCQFDPCQAQNVVCGEHGTCVAISETEAKCKCFTDYSGDACETTCGGYCLGGDGTYPYGCNPNLGATKVKYGCKRRSGCKYLAEGEDYPNAHFCTFKEVVHEWDCLESGSIFRVNLWRGGEVILTGDVKVWPGTPGLSAYGHATSFITFQDGDRITPWTYFS